MRGTTRKRGEYLAGPKLKERGDRIKELRRLAPGRPSQETVAHAIDVTVRGYQAWERGESEIRYENLERLAAYFGTTAAYIEYGRETPPTLIGMQVIDERDRYRDALREIEATTGGRAGDIAREALSTPGRKAGA